MPGRGTMKQYTWECPIKDCDIHQKYIDKKKLHTVRAKARRGGVCHLKDYHGLTGVEPIIVEVKQ